MSKIPVTYKRSDLQSDQEVTVGALGRRVWGGVAWG